jgi:hypothetical protein
MGSIYGDSRCLGSEEIREDDWQSRARESDVGKQYWGWMYINKSHTRWTAE